MKSARLEAFLNYVWLKYIADNWPDLQDLNESITFSRTSVLNLDFPTYPVTFLLACMPMIERQTHQEVNIAF